VTAALVLAIIQSAIVAVFIGLVLSGALNI